MSFLDLFRRKKDAPAPRGIAEKLERIEQLLQPPPEEKIMRSSHTDFTLQQLKLKQVEKERLENVILPAIETHARAVFDLYGLGPSEQAKRIESLKRKARLTTKEEEASGYIGTASDQHIAVNYHEFKTNPRASPLLIHELVAHCPEFRDLTAHPTLAGNAIQEYYRLVNSNDFQGIMYHVHHLRRKAEAFAAHIAKEGETRAITDVIFNALVEGRIHSLGIELLGHAGKLNPEFGFYNAKTGETMVPKGKDFKRGEETPFIPNESLWDEIKLLKTSTAHHRKELKKAGRDEKERVDRWHAHRYGLVEKMFAGIDVKMPEHNQGISSLTSQQSIKGAAIALAEKAFLLEMRTLKPAAGLFFIRDVTRGILPEKAGRRAMHSKAVDHEREKWFNKGHDAHIRTVDKRLMRHNY